MSAEPLQTMIAALGLETAAIKKRGGAQQILLRGGVQTGSTDSSYPYQFPFSEEKSLRDDTPVRIVVGQDEANGTVVSLKDGVLTVSLDKDLGPRIPSARLIADDSFLVERLKEKLEKVASGEARFDKGTAGRVIGLGKVRSRAAKVPEEILDGLNPPNAEQREAISRSLGSNLTFVWGPPGTGKTATVARIVEGHYRAGRSVLLVSNTNIAVDTALEDAECLPTGAAIRKSYIRNGTKVRQLRQFEPEDDGRDLSNIEWVVAKRSPQEMRERLRQTRRPGDRI